MQADQVTGWLPTETLAESGAVRYCGATCCT